MSEPILRATGPTDEVYDVPSEDALFELMGDLRSAGQSLRIERLEEEREGEWAVVSLNEHGLYVFETSDHLHYTSSLRAIHDFLAKWTFDLFEAD